jgi:hypothetical protein
MENCIKEQSERLILIKGKEDGINMKFKIRISIVLIIISPISKFCAIRHTKCFDHDDINSHKHDNR